MTGRPSKIDQVVAHDSDGNPITAHDRIIQALRLGDYLETAAAAAGVTKDSVYHWLRTGADTTARQNRATTLGQKFQPTKFQRQCQAFSDAVARATAEWHLSALTTLEQLARGGRTARTITEKRDGNGDLVERTVRTEELPPNAQVLEWRLTRRFPHVYSPRVDVALLGTDDGWADEDAAAGSLADELAAFQAGAAAAMEVHAIEATAQEPVSAVQATGRRRGPRAKGGAQDEGTTGEPGAS